MSQEIVVISISILNFFTILFLMFYEIKSKSVLVHPAFLHLVFSFISSCIVLNMAFNYERLLSVASDYGVDKSGYVLSAFSVFYVVNLLAYLGLKLFSKINFTCFLSLFPVSKVLNGKVFLIPLILGLFLVCLLIQSVGGLSYLWSNIGDRQNLFAGYGYLIKISVLLIQVSSFFIFAFYVRRHFYLALFFVSFSGCVLLLLGGRTPFIFLLFVCFIYYHVTVKEVVISIRKILMLVFLLYVSLVMAGLRGDGKFDEFISFPVEFSEKVVVGSVEAFEGYFTKVIRDAVILQYFSRNDYWYGATYTSLLYAPFPSVLFPDKPPIDVGRYVVAMSAGYVLTPPVPVSDLPDYGWPESYMSGYMNFGFIGMILFVLFSCFIVVIFYKLALYSSFYPGYVFVYGSLIFRGVTYMTPMDVVNLIFLLCFVIFFMYYYRLMVSFR